MSIETDAQQISTKEFSWPSAIGPSSFPLGDDALAKKFHSPEFAGNYARRRAQQRAWLKNRAKERKTETILDPEEYSSSERRRAKALERYFRKEAKPRGGDPRDRLPVNQDDTVTILAGRFRIAKDRITQGVHLEDNSLSAKAKRFVLCQVIGRRLDCPNVATDRFHLHYRCGLRYCTICGPEGFRQRFARLLDALKPVVDRLQRKPGRRIVIAKLDFTIPNLWRMPTHSEVRKFHADIRRFWRAAELRFGISRGDYGVVGCDEFGASNTNLHRHCVYVGPWLPQKHKELSALWSEIRGERSFVSLKFARNFAEALGHAMKYPAKFITESTPKRRADLETVFHRTRRISSGGAFYGVLLRKEKKAHWCPNCSVGDNRVFLIEIREPWVPVTVLEQEGRLPIKKAQAEATIRRVCGPP